MITLGALTVELVVLFSITTLTACKFMLIVDKKAIVYIDNFFSCDCILFLKSLFPRNNLFWYLFNLNINYLINELDDQQIGFYSLQENIDTNTRGGKLVFHILWALAEFECLLIKERTQTYLKAARAKGRLGGRPPLLNFRQIKRLIELYDE